MSVAAVFSHGHCATCGKHDYIGPLHGERGGPRCCLLCIGKWDAEHTPRRRARRIAIRALKAYQAAGGSLYGKDFDKLKLAVSFESDATTDDFKDLTTELLTAALALTHPDRHPPERRAEALRVTQELAALKPFVFPAPEPEPEPTRQPSDDALNLDKLNLNKLFDYPCEDCRGTVPLYYCDPCRAEHDKRERQEFEQRTAKQRAEYARRRKEALAWREPTICPICQKEFTRKRADARYCSARCRQQAHRKAPVTDKHQRGAETSTIRNRWRRDILALLDRHGAVYLNDLLPNGYSRAQYQQLCRVVTDMEDRGKIESISYWTRTARPGHKALIKPGHAIEDRDISLLKNSERLKTT